MFDKIKPHFRTKIYLYKFMVLTRGLKSINFLVSTRKNFPDDVYKWVSRHTPNVRDFFGDINSTGEYFLLFFAKSGTIISATLSN